jgi:hypothetical protein
MLTFNTSQLTTLERAAIESKRQSAESAQGAEPPSFEEYLQMHASHLLKTHVDDYVTSQLPSLQARAIKFLNCTPAQQAEIDEKLDSASAQASVES